MDGRAKISAALGSIALGAVLLWPALYNGQPIFFGDTSAYIRGADAGVQALFHRRSAWSLTGSDAIVHATVQGGRAAKVVPARRAAGRIARGSSLADKSIVSGRSPYYGALLYLGDLTGGFWLSIVLQSAAVVLAILLVLRAAGTRGSPWLMAGGVVLAAATTAPFFVSFLEPDIFAGVAVLVCAALLGGADRLQLGPRLLAFCLLAGCLVVHESHPLIVGILLVLALARTIMRSRPVPATAQRRRSALGIVAAAVLVAVLGQLAFGLVVKHIVGTSLLRPPFLMARMIEDGPGYRYLRASCPGSGFAVCGYLDRLPVAANLFLWDPSPRGVFSAVPPTVRRALAAEQTRFVWSVLAYAPGVELRDALRDVGMQLTMTGLQEFQYPEVLKQNFEEKIPPVHLRRMKRTAAFRDAMPVGLFSIVTGVTFVLSAIAVILALSWPRLRGRLPPRLTAVTAWIIAGGIVNSVVCGVLSGPHDRYAARVGWAVPLAALLIGAAAFEHRRHHAPNAAASAAPA